MTEYNPEAWAADLCTLLDRIAMVTTEPEVEELCHARFDIGRRHGLTVVFYGEQPTHIQ